MADSFTPNYNIIKPEVGADSGTWGTLLNNGAFAVLDNISAAQYSTSITAADVTLTTTQFQVAGFVLSGTLTGNRNLILPYQTGTTSVACGGRFYVQNNTQGLFTVTVKTQAATAGSLTATVPQGQNAWLYSDGINVQYADTGLSATVPAVSGSPTSQLAGTAGTTNANASLAADFTNGFLYLCTQSGTAGSAQWTNVSNPQGFDAARNFSFTATVSGNVLTIAALTITPNTTPAVGNPVVIPFMNNGGSGGFAGFPIVNSFTSSLSISTIVGATFGAANNTPFRLWLLSVRNGSAGSLALVNCSDTTGIAALNEGLRVTTVAMSSGATSTGVIYTPSAVTISAQGFRVLGYVDYNSGLVTAGTFNNPPDSVVIFGPGTKKPGDIVQIASGNTATTTITPSSSINHMLVNASGRAFLSAASNTTITTRLRRSGTIIATSSVVAALSGSNAITPVAFSGMYDSPATTSAVAYNISGSGATVDEILCSVQEIMG